MRVRVGDIPRVLEQKSPRAWLVAGDEPFQLGEACDLIRRHAFSRGFSERRLFSSDSGFDWADVLNAGQSMGLFAGRTLIEIRLGDKRPDRTGSEILQQLLGMATDDVCLLVSSTRLDRRRDLNSKWVTAIDQAGALVEIWPVEAAALPGWIEQRLTRAGLRAEPDAVALLAQRSEGNLLACAQEVDKLALLCDDGTVTVARVQEAVGDSSRHTVFDLTDVLAEPERALRILDGLRAEGSETPVVLWGLTRELRMLDALAAGNAGAVRVPPRKLAAMERLALGLGRDNIARALAMAARIDQMIKGMRPGDPWQGLAALVLRLGNRPLPPVLEQS